jgi:hypothetical protein
MRSKFAIGLAGVAAASVALASPAFAGTGTASPTTNLTNNQLITVGWDGFTGGAEKIYVHECWKDGTDPTFDFALDCGPLTQRILTAAPSGSIANFKVFAGDEPSGDMPHACGFTNDASLGNTVHPTCFVRVTDNSAANNGEDVFIPITFAVTPPVDVPEVPLNVLLPLGAAAVLGAGLFINRKRLAA